MPKSKTKLQHKIKNSTKKSLPVMFLLPLFIVGILYFFLLAPRLTGFLNEKISIYAREMDSQEVNSLDLIATPSAIQSSYSMSSLFEEIPLKNIKSNTRYVTVDPRIVAMKKFLDDYHSPMAPYAETFIDEADEYGLDWRMVASISGVESAFGNLIPYQSNNGWGWRGGPNGAYSLFTSWNDGIITVTRGLALGYGITLTPFDIESTYCPPCGENPAHLWANGVNNFMNELQYYLDNLDDI
jgi:hypothetical protein